jgi:prepilin-type N-terminal cleavage/methylation domain-containing protein
VIKLPKDCKNGFTLIELLVVIAIISFLLAIILPIIGRAKDQSKLIVCKVNLRSLALGCLTYSSENNSRLPVEEHVHNSHIKLVEKLFSGSYIQEPKNYYCPSEGKDELKYSEDNFKNGDIGYFYYCFNDKPTKEYAYVLSSFLIRKVHYPRMLVDTMNPNKWIFSDSWFAGAPTAHRWYKKGVNFVTLDTSVHMVKQSPKREFK